MTPVKLLIVEDNLLTAESISGSLAKEGYAVTAITREGEKVMSCIQDDLPDLVLMDIHLAGKMDGIAAAKAVKRAHSIPVIFLTDYDDLETVQRASETGPADYLLKPFNERQLFVSIERALYHASCNQSPQPGENETPGHDQYGFNDNLFIRDKKGGFRKLPVHDILYIEADRSYCTIHTVSGAAYLQTNPMTAISGRINLPSLMQVHRSYIVNLARIEGLRGNTLILGKSEIPVSETYRAAVQARIALL